VLKALKAHKVLREKQARQEPQALRDRKAIGAIPVRWVRKGRKAIRETPVRSERQGHRDR
jgi:hypothetical protein